MIPIYDQAPTRRTPILTIGIILACFGVFLYQQTLPNDGSLNSFQAFVCEWGTVPAHTIEGPDPALDISRTSGDLTCQGVSQLHDRWTGLFTGLFLHGDWMHLLGNMLFLWIFGNNVEDRLGRLRFLPFYLGCGALASLAQAITEPSSGIPSIGASGAISAIIGAYLVLLPRSRIWSLIGFVIPLPLPAWLWGAIYFGMQFLGLSSNGLSDGGGIAYWAHIGGFIAGFLLIRIAIIGRPPPPDAVLRRPPPGFHELRR
ncbi:MAG: rhomboid family intramembrane serine protease [Actinobacteria bacterium]|nr:rhomboid family intramembrane serine protease [Thermoleophilia bacterium]MCB9011716.1 rhomboid family intramembrane serine protease [Actinomycetota bacterium]